MNRIIKKIAVLGSGVMGSRIACHFANIGIEVLLLDIVPKEPNPAESAKGLTTESPIVRNRIVNDALAAAVNSNPSPLYKKSFQSRIKTGNFDDNLKDLGSYDWILEAVVENLAIKQSLYEKVEEVRAKGSIISTNTSGIPMGMLCQGRSEDFKTNFCGTHFFNPPRYLKLLEIIPGPNTSPELLKFITQYGEKFLGKDTVICKDTPAFIANRVGIYSIMEILHSVEKLDLSVEEVDKLTGPIIGRPKSATFRTGDVVGLDTLINVANNLSAGLKTDERKDVFLLPGFLKTMGENKWLGDKTGQGFYKKTKNASGETEILSLDLKTLEYKPQGRSKFSTLDQTKAIDDVKKRFKVLVAGQDKAGEFYRNTFGSLFAYVSNRVPEIADELFRIDAAMIAGFGWEHGPFEIWDAIGVKNALPIIESTGNKVAPWVNEMLTSGIESFYKTKGGIKNYYDILSKSYKPIPGREAFIILEDLKPGKVVWGNADCSIIDLGDGILNCEFHSKMNTLGSGVVAGINMAIEMAEKNYRGLVIGNQGANFSVGANLAMLLMYAVDQEWDEINLMIHTFQNTMMRARYSSIPVVVAPHGLTLGGGCELSLHADRVVAAAETYTGLVEFGVGLIPAGGGTKEMTLRFSENYEEGDVLLNSLRNTFLTVGQAKVSTSAHEAFDLGFYRRGDIIVVNKNQQIAEAKRVAQSMADAGYTMPQQRKDIRVLGKQGLGIIYVGAASMHAGRYISEHDKLISEKLGYIMCGGDLSQPSLVSEQYLLNLEREAFLSLCGEKKTLERIKHMLDTGKPLRN